MELICVANGMIHCLNPLRSACLYGEIGVYCLELNTRNHDGQIKNE